MRNPLDWAIGLAIKDLRVARQMEIDAYAKVLGISESYLRTVEAGTATLPPDCARGLVWGLGANFTAVSGLLVLAKVLDKRTNRAPDISVVKDLAAEILKAEKEQISQGQPQLPKQYREVLERIQQALELSLKTPTPNDQIEDLVKDTSKEISRWLHGETIESEQRIARTSEQPSFGERYNLSPVFEDLIEGFAARLALFPPQTTSFEFDKWEVTNSARICKVHAFHSDPALLVDIANKGGAWGFLWNRNTPKVWIYTSSEKSKAVPQIQRDLRKAIAVLSKGKKDRREGNVHVRAISSRLAQECQRGLRFDFARPDEPPLAKNEHIIAEETAQYRVFSNAWLYELIPDTLESHRAGDRTYRIGFLDTYQLDLRSTYAIVMSHAHVKYWSKIFHDANSKE